MKEYQSQSHVRYECKCHLHIVLCPKFRRKKLYGRMRIWLGEMMHDLCRQKGVELIEGQTCTGHVNMCLNIPFKYSVASIVNFLKDKNAIGLNKDFSIAESTRKYFLIRSYFVSTVGINEKTVLPD